MADGLDGRAPIVIGDRLAIAPCPPAARFVFRGTAEAAARAGGACGVALPLEPCRAATSGSRAALWLGPDEWLLLASPAEAEALAAAITAALAGQPHALVEVSDAHAALTVSGKRAASLLAAGCALDLDPRLYPVGMCTRTLLAKVAVVLWRQSAGSFRIELRRSVNIRRVEQALETQPDAVAVACPFCMTMVDDGLKAKGLEEQVAALDVMEVVAGAMK